MVNSIEDIKKFVNDKGFTKIFVLCGKKSFVSSGAEILFKRLLTNKEIKLFYKKSELPILEELIEIIIEIRNFKPDLILGVGGGAIIDYAKIANIVDVKDNLKDLIVNYSYPFKEKFSKLVVIPTTAGSGAEVTSNAVIYVDKIKYSFESELLIPDNFFLIPEFLISAPNKIKASAGFDAIAQALESIISMKSNDKSVDYASKSLKISLDSYISFLKNPDLKNAAQMSIAANLAGKAISISKTTAPHAVSYPFTSHHGISHGHAVLLTLPDFLLFNFKNLEHSKTSFSLKNRFDIIFKCFNVDNIFNLEQKIKSLAKNVGLETNFSKLKISNKSQISNILSHINKQRLANNPVDVEIDNI